MVRALTARTIAIGLMLAGGLAIAAGPAEAARSCNGKARSTAAPDAQAIDAATRNMSMNGASDSEVDAWLQNELCLQKVGTEPIGTFGGVGEGDVSWSTAVYYDGPSGRYLVKGNWSWNNHDYASDYSYWLYGCNGSSIGGLDAMGIRLDSSTETGFNIYNSSASSWGDPGLDSYANDYGYWSTSSTWSASKFGVAFKKQDHAKGVRTAASTCRSHIDFDMYRGQVYTWVDSKGGCQSNTQVFPMYAHTWSSTAVNSVGVGPYSFSIGWSGGGSKWKYEVGGKVATIC